MMTALLVFTTRVSMYSTHVFFYYLCMYIATALSNIELRMISLYIVGYYLIPLVCILSCRKSSPRPKTAMRRLMNQFLIATIKHGGNCRQCTNYVYTYKL